MAEVFYIDDDSEFHHLVRAFLGETYPNIFCASSIEAARNILDKEKPDLILLDLQMPGEDGFDFLESRQGDKRLQEIPEIVLSAHNDREIIVRAMSAGAQNYVVKPFLRESLHDRVRKTLHMISADKVNFEAGQQQVIQAETEISLVACSSSFALIESDIHFYQGSTVHLKGMGFIGDYDHIEAGIEKYFKADDGRYTQLLKWRFEDEVSKKSTGAWAKTNSDGETIRIEQLNLPLLAAPVSVQLQFTVGLLELGEHYLVLAAPHVMHKKCRLQLAGEFMQQQLELTDPLHIAVENSWVIADDKNAMNRINADICDEEPKEPSN